ncbi:MAG: flagellar biosynthesis protein FlhF [Planctomycetota bacterium]
MKLKTISAPTMAEAIKAVKTELGANAVILHTRQVKTSKWMGLRRSLRVEVIAGLADKKKQPKPPVKRTVPTLAEALPPQAMPKPAHSEVLAALAKKSLADLAPDAAPGAGLLNTPVAGQAAMRSLNKEVSDLKTMVKDLVKLQHDATRPDLPESLFDSYLRLVEGEVADELADRIVRDIKQVAQPAQLGDEASVRKLLAEKIAGLVPTSGPIQRRHNDAPTVVALIGPTGVGKTTTVAKLAANLQLVQNMKVGLLTIDTYRIAAVDQLRKFSEIINARLEVAHTAAEIPQALASFADCDFILLDTAGRSPKDEMHLRELEQCLKVAKPDEIHLVMSASQGRSSSEMVVEKFGALQPDSVIFTKVDEAVQLGVVLNVAHKLGKSLSYITYGQNVPNDIEVGCARRLAKAILGEELSPSPTPMPDGPGDQPTDQADVDEDSTATDMSIQPDRSTAPASSESVTDDAEVVEQNVREEAA